ncbi:hypothetical protein HYS95_00045 [Candidatus Daviesbacteria bacterium]|nr:hypothetical protein [Candidatus Daviesbacteria bacterium]
MIKLVNKTAQKGIVDPKIIIGGIVALAVIIILATGKFNFSASRNDQPSSESATTESQSEPTQAPSAPKSYNNGQYKFSLEYPGEWDYKEAQGQYVTAFFSPLESSSDRYREFLGVKVVSTASKPDITLQQATDLWEEQTVAASKDKNFQITDRKSSTIAGNEARDLFFTVDIEGIAAKGFAKITMANENIYIFQYFAETDKYEKFLPDLESIISSVSL